jgi:hypothetical protein
MLRIEEDVICIVQNFHFLSRQDYHRTTNEGTS